MMVSSKLGSKTAVDIKNKTNGKNKPYLAKQFLTTEGGYQISDKNKADLNKLG
jgi:hypothetical protein